MVGLDDLDVVGVPKGARRRLGEPERQVDPRGHVRRQHDRDFFRSRRDAFVLLSGEARRPDDHAHSLPEALLEMRQRSLGTGEIDQAIAFGDAIGELGGDLDAAREPHELSGVFAYEGAAGRLDGRRELEIARAQRRLDQGSPHAPSGPRDDQLHGRGFPGGAAATMSPSTRFNFPSSKNTAMRRYSTSGLLARWRTNT